MSLIYFSTACAFISRTLHSTFNFYSDASPFTVTDYNYLTDEKPRLKFKGYEDIDLKLSTEEFYIRKTFKLSDFYLDSGKAFKESEARREKDRYLTLR